MDSGLKAHQHVEDKKDSDGDQDRDSGDQLKRAVQKQIEYYFSRENLITDTYLSEFLSSRHPVRHVFPVCSCTLVFTSYQN